MHMIPNEIQQAMYGFIMSHVLFVGDEIEIFDRIAQENISISNTEALAQGLGLNPDALERLLLAAIAIGLIEKKDGFYKIPEHLRPFLQKNTSEYCGKIFFHFRNSTIRLFPYLKEALKENKPQWKQIFSNVQNDLLFPDLYEETSYLETFLLSMWSMGYLPAKELVQKYSLEKYKILVDVGGATGSFAIAALENCLSLKAIVFDLPNVRQFLEKNSTKYKLSERLTFVNGNFFEDDLPKGDVYALGYILSDWPKEKGTFLLRKIYESLPKGGCVLILEKLFNQDKNGPLETAMMNLVMLLETWGQHYSENEYMSWLQEVGFENCQVIRSSKDKHMIVGIKPN